MANELLDFVMSLVRDSDAAARYAADPARVLAEARLDGVTSADVNNLLPMVADSVAMSTPLFGVRETGDASVWTSGAAAAAFDSFTPRATADDDAGPAVSGVTALAATDLETGHRPFHDAGSPFGGSDTFPQFEASHPEPATFEDASPAGTEPHAWDAWHGDTDGDAGHAGIDFHLH